MRLSSKRLEDDILILEYRKGHSESLEKLILRWQSKLRWYIFSLVKEESASWDISQEVWISAISAMKKHQRIENFSAWIYGTARHQTISYLRKKKCLQSLSDEMIEQFQEITAPMSDLLQEEENLEILQQCLSLLPFKQREILSLFYLQDLSLQEIADISQTPVGTIQSRLYYGRLSLKNHLIQKGYAHGK